MAINLPETVETLCVANMYERREEKRELVSHRSTCGHDDML